MLTRDKVGRGVEKLKIQDINYGSQKKEKHKIGRKKRLTKKLKENIVDIK